MFVNFPDVTLPTVSFYCVGSLKVELGGKTHGHGPV